MELDKPIAILDLFIKRGTIEVLQRRNFYAVEIG